MNFLKKKTISEAVNRCDNIINERIWELTTLGAIYILSRQVYYYLGGLFDFVIFVKLRVQPVTGRDRRGFILFRCQLVVKMPNLVFQSEGQMPHLYLFPGYYSARFVRY